MKVKLPCDLTSPIFRPSLLPSSRRSFISAAANFLWSGYSSASLHAGDADFICNWLGNRAWTNALEWPGQDGFVSAKTKTLKVGGEKYGNVKTYGNFTFMQIYEAGHMTPMDQPEASLDFINRWVSGEWFA